MNGVLIIIVVSSLLLVVCCFVYGYFFELYDLRAEKIEIPIRNLPSDLNGLKIIHLSDFHCRKFTEREKKVIKFIQEAHPDFIFFTGDFLENEKYIPVCQKLISQISNPVRNGVSNGARENPNFYGVFGNHDHRSGATIDKLKEIFEKEGIKILVNEAKEITKIDGSSFYLIGVDDPYLGYDNLEEAAKNVQEGFKILLSHSPEILEREKNEIVNKYKIDLILAGHTHSGQVNLPIYNSIFRWFSGYKYIAGLFEENGTAIYVNRGIGVYSGTPLRLNAPPEITLITLRIENRETNAKQ